MTTTSEHPPPPYAELFGGRAAVESLGPAITAANAKADPGESFFHALTNYRLFAIDHVKRDLVDATIVDDTFIRKSLDAAWVLYVRPFRQVTGPMIAEAYITAFRNVQQNNVPIKMIYALADEHADRIGRYFNDTSTEALIEGFNATVNKQVPRKAALQRVLDGYGLTPRQMSGFVALEPDRRISSTTLTPAGLRQKALRYVAKSLSSRFGTFMRQERHNLDMQAQQVAWMWLVHNGKLPSNTKKKWHTAKDEKVCKQCGPLDNTSIPVGEQFELPNGNKLYVPGAHVNCRCTAVLEIDIFETEGGAITKVFEPKAHPRGKGGKFIRIKRSSVGFTGTRKGMTPRQKEAVFKELSGASELHSGLAKGADNEVESAWKGKHQPHPITKDKPPLARNHDIVDESDRLVAAPKGFKEELRSGTWATVRYARKQKKPISIVWPDGNVTRENVVAKADFDPEEHPRGGNPENPGQFSRKSGEPQRQPSAKKSAPQQQPRVAEQEIDPRLLDLQRAADAMAAEAPLAPAEPVAPPAKKAVFGVDAPAAKKAVFGVDQPSTTTRSTFGVDQPQAQMRAESRPAFGVDAPEPKASFGVDAPTPAKASFGVDAPAAQFGVDAKPGIWDIIDINDFAQMVDERMRTRQPSDLTLRPRRTAELQDITIPVPGEGEVEATALYVGHTGWGERTSNRKYFDEDQHLFIPGQGQRNVFLDSQIEAAYDEKIRTVLDDIMGESPTVEWADYPIYVEDPEIPGSYDQEDWTAELPRSIVAQTLYAALDPEALSETVQLRVFDPEETHREPRWETVTYGNILEYIAAAGESGSVYPEDLRVHVFEFEHGYGGGRTYRDQASPEVWHTTGIYEMARRGEEDWWRTQSGREIPYVIDRMRPIDVEEGTVWEEHVENPWVTDDPDLPHDYDPRKDLP